MSLVNISFCRYLADPSCRSQESWDVAKIVRAIKDDPINGYADLKIGGKFRRLDADHRQVATDWFVDRVVSETDIYGREYILCPIPDSQCTPSSSHTPRTLLLAQSLSKRLPDLKVWPHLKFKKPMARKVRDELVLYQNMVCTEHVPSGYIILLDDVCTTGAHARAAQRRLMENGAKDMCAMSVTRTILNPEAEVFGFRADPI
jgi:hypothetical protein